MPISLSQAYSHFVQERDYNPDTVNYENFQEILYDLKEAIIAGGQWTVWGSHDGQDNLGNNDAVDRWTSPSQINRTLSNRDPWIVLEGPVGMGSPQICIAAEYSSGQSWMGRVSIVVSPSGGFGVSGGGTDGTTTARPTATDEDKQVDALAGNLALSGTDDCARTTVAAEGADGSLFLWFRQGQQTILFGAVVKTVNAPVALDNGVVWMFRSDTPSSANQLSPELNSARQAVHFGAANWRGMVSGTFRAMYLGTRGWNGGSFALRTSVRQGNAVPVSQADLFASDLAAQGYYGTIPDLYYCLQLLFRVLLGDTAGGAPKFIALDSLIVPWDPTAAKPSEVVK